MLGMNWKIIAKSLGQSDMRNRILAVLGMLLVFRILAHIPVPLSDPATLKQLLDNLFTQANTNQFLGFVNALSGGALANFSILLVGLGPYINASIIMQILTKAIPRLEALNKEGEFGRKKINQYTRMLTFPLAIIQAIGTIYLIRQTAISIGGLGDITANASIMRWVLMVATLTGGAMILMWLGELITERSVGNGISLLITVGILSGLPQLVNELAASTVWTTGATPADKLVWGGHNFSRHGLTVVSIVTAAIVFVTWAVVKLNEASRKLTVNYAKRVQGSRAYGGITTTLPVKLIGAGVIPIIFAIAILSVPSFAGQLLAGSSVASGVAPTGFWQNLGVQMLTLFQNPTAQTFAAGGWQPWIYPLTYFLLVFVFTYFYTSVVFNAKEIAENLQKQGGFLADIRSGAQTEKYLRSVVNRLTLFGGFALGLLAVLPIIGQIYATQSIAIGGTSLLILVSVSLDTLRKIESRALMITYDQYDQADYFYTEEPSSQDSLKKQRRFRWLRRFKL